MKFLVVLALIVTAAAGHVPVIDRAKLAAALRLLTSDASQLTKCNSGADCSATPGKPNCDAVMKLCKPENAPSFDLIDLAGILECGDDSHCAPLYRCKSNKCHFSGPKACDQDADCLEGVEGLKFDCKELGKSGPGKRCWRKCSADSDCHDRMPDQVRPMIGCCQGHCQKKAVCSTD